MRGRPKLYTDVAQPAPVRVLIPYTEPTPLLQTVVDGLRIQHVRPELHRVDGGDAYWRLLRDTWAEGGEFFVVEQDVFVWQGAIRQLAECSEDWCTLATLCHGRMITTTFGCVKFGHQLIERNPGFWDDISPYWAHLDANFADKSGWPFVRPHSHWPPASHLNEVQWGEDITSKRVGFDRKLGWQSMEEGRAVVRVQAKDGRVIAATVDREG